LIRNRHEWYRQAAQDYAAHTPIFVGSKLKEPILSLELDRARRSPSEGLGKAFLVSPDAFTPIQEGNLRARQIVHLKGTLADFVTWLKTQRPEGVPPEMVVASTNVFAAEKAGELSITPEDLDTARAIYPISGDRALAQLRAKSESEYRQLARKFLEGFPPSWEIASSDIPVWLANTESLFAQLRAAVARRDRLLVVFGQSGSGKTTATMQALVRLQRESPATAIYEVRAEVRSLQTAFNLLERLHPDQQVIVFLGDAFLYGDSLAEDILGITSGRITVVVSARTGEWRDHHQRHLGEIAVPFEYQRFVRQDYQPVVDRLIQYVPAPKLQKLSPDQRLDAMARSRSQLLIAMREATQSQKFTDVITEEYHRLPDEDAKVFVLISAIATIARLGIRPEMAREAYNSLRKARTFYESEAAAAAIVSETDGGRLFARHELYVRHIVENVVTLREVLDVVVAMLRTFTKYEIPVVRNVGRQDGNLFRFLLNHNFLTNIAKRHGSPGAAVDVYDAFELEFQLDGHYWLQYGQCLAELNRFEEAHDKLQKSIDAYSGNTYARHALSSLKLRVAERRTEYDAVTAELIGDAVATLKDMDATVGLQIDEYPIVTLAHGHVAALMKHGRIKQAEIAAREYFDRIQQMEKRNPGQALQTAKERLAHFLTTGRWEPIRSPQRWGRGRRRR